jgi:MFS family permease
MLAACMTQHSPAAPDPGNSLWSAFFPILPFMLVVFTGFLATGMTIPVVPRHVHDTLGQGTAIVGIVMGIQYAAAVFARVWAGGVTDGRGPHVATRGGMVAAVAVGLLYLASVALVDARETALGLVIAGRLMSGVTEAFVLTSTMTWALLRMGPGHAGKVFAWIGVALFGGFAVGSPLGSALYGAFGFRGVAIAIVLAGVLGLAGTSFMEGVTPTKAPRLSFTRVLGVVKLPGLALTLCSLGYAMITAFAVLLFAQRGWGGGALAVTCMSAGFISCRLLFGHLPDQLGGVRVAMFAVLAEAVGLALIWASPHPLGAWLGAALTGAGYGLAFQGFGVEAVQRTPPQSRGAAMGAYLIFQDLSLGMGPPVLGLLAQGAGLNAVYLAAAVGAVLSAAVAWLMLKQGAPTPPVPRRTGE